MARRFNYTGRKRLQRKDIAISLEPQEGTGGSFSARLDLGGYGFPKEAQLWVEAYRQTSWMRFGFGTIGNPEIPRDRQLNAFDNLEAVLFRVKVVTPGEPHGKLVGVLDRIRPGEPEDDEEDHRIPLLPVKPQDLGAEVWRVEIEDQPRLLVNSALGDGTALVKTPEFLGLVFPTALREILQRVLIDDAHRDTEDSDDWRSQWLRFATRIPGVDQNLPDEDGEGEVRDWIDEAVSAFCRGHDILRRFEAAWQAGGRA